MPHADLWLAPHPLRNDVVYAILAHHPRYHRRLELRAGEWDAGVSTPRLGVWGFMGLEGCNASQAWPARACLYAARYV